MPSTSFSGQRASCVGAGTIGQSWAIVLARAGFSVSLYDPSKDALDAAMLALRSTATPGQLARIAPTTDLAAALNESVYVQESIPEQLPLKRELFDKLLALAPSTTLFGSSTSTLPGSSFLCGFAGSDRCLVVHPTNPPHLVPLVELCRTPETAPATYDAVWQLMADCDQTPVEVNKEIFGFVLNRLQAAVVAEALSLVSEDVVSPADLDRVMTEGLGLRWALMGPFETGHLNSPGGYFEYMSKFRTAWEQLFGAIGRPMAVNDALVRKIDTSLRAELGPDVAAQQVRRNHMLDRLRTVLREGGE